MGTLPEDGGDRCQMLFVPGTGRDALHRTAVMGMVKKIGERRKSGKVLTIRMVMIDIHQTAYGGMS